MLKNNKAGVLHQFVKNKNYKKVLEKISKTNKCPFCSDNFIFHKNPIIKKYNGWIVTKNGWPYKNSQHHFLLIPERHLKSILEVSLDDFNSLKYLIRLIFKKYNIKGGALAVRFGDQKLSGASVSHLHFHLIICKLNNKGEMAKAVNFEIGFKNL